MAKLVLTTGHPKELYPLEIRKQMTALEQYFGMLVQRQLDMINSKVLSYARSKLNTQKSIGEVAARFVPSDFYISLSALSQAAKIGVMFQKDMNTIWKDCTFIYKFFNPRLVS